MRLFGHLYCLNIYIGTLPTALMSNRIETPAYYIDAVNLAAFITSVFVF